MGKSAFLFIFFGSPAAFGDAKAAQLSEGI